MPITYRIDQSARVIFITGNGVVTEEELIAHQEALLQDPECDPAFGRLSDLTGATDFKVSAAGMLQAYLNVGTRRAVVASEQPAGRDCTDPSSNSTNRSPFAVPRPVM